MQYYKCYQCLGFGLIEVRLYANKHGVKHLLLIPKGNCSVCGGSGSIDWVENTTKSSGIDYFKREILRDDDGKQYVFLSVGLEFEEMIDFPAGG